MPGTSGPAPMSEVDSSGTASRAAQVKRRTVRTVVLLAVTVLFVVLAVVFRQQTTSGDSGDNQALVDSAATSEVNGRAKDATSKLFSYDFANTAKSETAAKQVLVGPAVQQYEQLFQTVKQQAPRQQLVVTTTVKSSGVKQLQGDRAEVLLFVNQNATRATTNENTVGQAQVSLSMVRQGDQWKINNITQR